MSPVLFSASDDCPHDLHFFNIAGKMCVLIDRTHELLDAYEICTTEPGERLVIITNDDEGVLQEIISKLGGDACFSH